MNWLSKLVLNNFEMPIKDAVARPLAESNWEAIHNYIWNGDANYKGNVYYVSPDGDDTNDGKTAQTPFKTIMHAYWVGVYPIACNRSTFTIMLASGTYNENVIIGNTDNDLKVNIFLGGDVTINGCIGVLNTKCWIFGTTGNEILTIIGTANSSNLGEAKNPLIVSESGELYINVRTSIMETETNLEYCVIVSFCSTLCVLAYMTISGTFTTAGIRSNSSTIRAYINSSNINADMTFYATDSLIQSIATLEDQTIGGYCNLYTGTRLTEYTP